MNKFITLTITSSIIAALMACKPTTIAPASAKPVPELVTLQQQQGKIVIYQAFARLFGNTNPTNIRWGTAAQNGVGKFNDINDAALVALKDMGVSHLWLTGVPHHALVADYSAFGISQDDPDVIKGRAGSPYAVKDYYSVNPDLAVDPAKRLAEFQALIARAHQHGIKVVIDIVPNHVARHYQSLGKPTGVRDFGADDDVKVEYAKHNNFYYVPGQAFELPDIPAEYSPLGNEVHPLKDGKFAEMPAKWTGNGARAAKPDFNDWYETVKINYGVKPDGSYDFDRLPAEYATRDYAAHAAFWQGKDVPNSWIKFRDITHYWLAFGVDGFRFDMAEMVPVEFWSYLNSSIKLQNPEALLLAEVYQPQLYRDYVQLGKMDYLYDKVGFYDSLKLLMQGKGTGTEVLAKQTEVTDIDQHMLKFLENHDEQRIASPEFAGSAEKGKPAMVVSTLIGKAPTLLYFGQEVGEAGALDAGFGKPSRTSIFDYVGVPAHQGWLNGGKYDGGGLTAEQQTLRQFYQQLLHFSSQASALNGEFLSLHALNLTSPGYSEQQLSFARWDDKQQLLVVSNFSDEAVSFQLQLPAQLVDAWQLRQDPEPFVDLFSQQTLAIDAAAATLSVSIPALGSLVLQRNGNAKPAAKNASK
ncbi:MAG: alpha amylase C-terminal domain-containing protein [Gammaproteobacteria bacterium]|nr:alpha amylase C-terminal domain-containing protein [Gammaproteobacteria bacterium]